MQCKFCGNEYLKVKQHELFCSLNPNKRKKFNSKNQHIKAKEEGYLVETKDSTRQKLREANLGKRWNEAQKQMHSQTMKLVVKNNPESYSINNVCGRVKNIEFNGHILKGSWELLFAEWLVTNNIKYTNKVDPQPYFWNNGWHLYFPDFYLSDADVYVEVKGFKRDRDIAKWSQFIGTLVIIDKTCIHNLDNFGGLAQLVEQRAYIP